MGATRDASHRISTRCCKGLTISPKHRKDGWESEEKLHEPYLWGCRGRGRVANRRCWIPAPWSPCHDFLCDIPASLIGVSDTDLGGRKHTKRKQTLPQAHGFVWHLHRHCGYQGCNGAHSCAAPSRPGIGCRKANSLQAIIAKAENSRRQSKHDLQVQRHSKAESLGFKLASLASSWFLRGGAQKEWWRGWERTPRKYVWSTKMSPWITQVLFCIFSKTNVFYAGCPMKITYLQNSSFLEHEKNLSKTTLKET